MKGAFHTVDRPYGSLARMGFLVGSMNLDCHPDADFVQMYVIVIVLMTLWRFS